MNENIEKEFEKEVERLEERLGKILSTLDAARKNRFSGPMISVLEKERERISGTITGMKWAWAEIYRWA